MKELTTTSTFKQWREAINNDVYGTPILHSFDLVLAGYANDLSLDIIGGNYTIDTAQNTIADQTLTLTTNSINYIVVNGITNAIEVYDDSNNIPVTNRVYLLHTVTVDATDQITGTSDKRSWLTVSTEPDTFALESLYGDAAALTAAVVSSQTSADNSATSASASNTSASLATSERLLVQAMRDEVQTKHANLSVIGDAGIPVEYTGDGVIPLTDANGELSEFVMSGKIAGLKEQLAGLDVVDMFLYDTSKDSDPTWVDRCEHFSWYNETLPTGRYLGAYYARGDAIADNPGAVNGDWILHEASGTFQMFDDLPTSSFTNITRASSKKFPTKALLVVDSARLIIFDVSGKQASMWRVFTTSNMHGNGNHFNTLTGVVAVNGHIYVSNGNSDALVIGLWDIDFAANTLYGIRKGTNGDVLFSNDVTAYAYWLDSVGGSLVGTAALDLAVTVLPDAPIDPVTGLKIPTVAVATDGGVSVIHNDGSVKNSLYTGVVYSVEFSDDDLLYQQASVGQYVAVPISATLSAGWIPGRTYALASSPATLAGVSVNSKITKGASSSHNGLTIIRENPSDPAAGMTAHITDKYNTGWMVGDTQGAWLCDTEVGAISGNAVHENNFDADISGYVTTATASTIEWDNVGSRLKAIKVDNSSTWMARGTGFNAKITLEKGKAYKISATVSANAGNIGATTASFTLWDAILGTQTTGVSSVSETVIALGVSFIAPSSGEYYPTLITGAGSVVGDIFYLDNVLVEPLVEDRSVNSNHLDIVGTLNRYVVGNGEIAFHNGWSNANYYKGPAIDISAGGYVKIWEYPQVGTVNNRTLIGNFDNLTNGGIAISHDGTASTYRIRYRNEVSSVLSLATNVPLTVGVIPRLHLLAYDGTDLIYYIDGIERARVTTSLYPMSYNWLVGVGRWSDAFADAYINPLALPHVSTNVPSIDQIKKMYTDELAMLNGKATIAGYDNNIKSMSYDKERGLLHAASGGVVSTFRNLQRVSGSLDGLADLVVNGDFSDGLTGWTTEVAITSVVDGHLVIDRNGSNNKNAFYQAIPTIVGQKYMYSTYVLDDGFSKSVKLVATSSVPAGATLVEQDFPNSSGKDITAYFVATSNTTYIHLLPTSTTVNTGVYDNVKVYPVSEAAPFTSIDANNGALVLGGSGGVDINIPSLTVREKLEQTSRQKDTRDFEFVGDGSIVAFTLPAGWKPKRVYVDGAKQRSQFTTSYDGFVYSVVFGVAPALDTEIDVEAEEV